MTAIETAALISAGVAAGPLVRRVGRAVIAYVADALEYLDDRDQPKV